jgi:hypothetical protein
MILKKVAIKKAFEPNVNGHTFPDYVLKNISEQINEKKPIIGTLGQDIELAFVNAVCFTDKAYYEGDTLYADITIMNTCPIPVADNIHETFTFGMRIMGNVEDGGTVTDCDIMSIDIIRKEDCV